MDRDNGITRVEVEETELTYTALRKELSAEAAVELGYKPEQNRYADYARRDLARALKAADIKPLHKGQVARYKARKLFFSKARHWFWGAWILGSLVTMAGLQGSWMGWIARTGVSLYLGMVCALLTHAAIHFRGKDRWDWRSESLSGYQRYVPEFALCYALEIKKANPLIAFRVEELTQTPLPDGFFVDPFLVAELNGESEYIAVWDEPKFESRKR